MQEFLLAVRIALDKLGIRSPAMIVKSDGSIVGISAAMKKPIETVLSGPVASIIGAKYLSDCANNNIKDAIIVDMGGTTTDIARLRDGNVLMNDTETDAFGFTLKVPSVRTRSIGLGGDSKIRITGNGTFTIGPERVLPACRSLDSISAAVTPTDLLHVIGTFKQWDTKRSFAAISALASAAGMTAEAMTEKALAAVEEKIYEACFGKEGTESFPLIAVGAPAESWFTRISKRYGIHLILPEHFDVANAVGAAVAEIRKTTKAVVRPGEDHHGFIVHLPGARHVFREKGEAEAYAVRQCSKDVRLFAEKEGGDNIGVSCGSEDIYSDAIDGTKIYIETRIVATARSTTGSKPI
jgi:N-methylhydantoinase A/oxoprolinase/acetone carboxylase beta subunit